MTTKTKTSAERVADRLDNDGRSFTTRGGQTLDSLARDAGARVERREARIDHERAVRYAFPDGSAIVSYPGAWDLSYSNCWCWRGAGHDDDCEAS